jgi:cytochrome o ubiquinol oxidase subunit IV
MTAPHSSSAHINQPEYGTGKKTLGIYSLGVALCIILTLIPFSVVMYQIGTHDQRVMVLIVSAILQFLVQVVCFLRLNVKTLQGSINVYAFVFSIIVLAVIIGGSLWIMWHLNYNMMH